MSDVESDSNPELIGVALAWPIVCPLAVAFGCVSLLCAVPYLSASTMIDKLLKKELEKEQKKEQIDINYTIDK